MSKKDYELGPDGKFRYVTKRKVFEQGPDAGHRKWQFKWMSEFIWFSFKKDKKGCGVSSSVPCHGWTIDCYCGQCPIYSGYYSRNKTTIRLGKLSIRTEGKMKLQI